MKNICLTFIYIMSQSPLFYLVSTYVIFGWASPRANLGNVNNAETKCWNVLKLTRYRSPSLSSSCSPSESPPHHGPTSPSSDRLHWFLFSSNISRRFSQFSDQQWRWERSLALPGRIVSTFQLDRAPFLWLALVLSLDLMTMTPLSVGLSCNTACCQTHSHLSPLPLTCME